MKSKTSKRLSILLTLALIFGIFAALPMTASAATRDVGTAATLKTALSSAVSGDTIRLTAHINTTDYIELIGKNLTIDLNGFNLSVSPAKTTPFTVTGSVVNINGPGTLTLNDTSGFGCCEVRAGGLLNLSDRAGIHASGSGGGSGRYNVAVSGQNSKATLKNSIGEEGVYAGGDGCELTLTGNVAATDAMSTGAYAVNGAKITIDGGISVPNPSRYIRVGTTYKSQSDYEATTTKTGYFTYTDGQNTVWVRNPASAPAITAHPQNEDIFTGGEVTFSVTATGTAPLTYEWQYSTNGIHWTKLSENDMFTGTGTASLKCSNVAVHLNNYRFQCVVSNTAGSVTSNTATLTVTTPVLPRIISQPVNRSAATGETVTFSVNATGTEPLTYRWTRSTDGGTTWSALLATYPGSTTNTLSVDVSSALENGFQYRCEVTNPAGSVTSNVATLTVTTQISITVGAQKGELLPGVPGTVSYDVTTTGLRAASREPISVSNLPAGVTAPTRTDILAGGTFTLVLTGDATTVEGITNNLVLRIVGIDSAPFSLTIGELKPFAAVTDITGVPTAAVVNAPLTLTGTVAPATATNRTVTWSVKSPGLTGATITDNIFKATAAGTATITATVKNGATETTDFTKDFPITVSLATVTVGAQSGTIAAGTAGNATFPVTTAGIDNGKTGVVSWFTSIAGITAGATPAGIIATVSNVASNAATVTMTATTTAAAGTYYFKVTIDGVTSSVATLTVTGAAKPDIPLPFTDVPLTAWYYNDVKTAYQSGLINGINDTIFAPDNNLTYAEAVKLAACMHQLYTTGSVTLTNGVPWYQSYADYAKANGIISADYNWNAPATRSVYMDIFAHALPAATFTVINNIADGAIPDVPMTHLQAASIYRMYRAGIVQGDDAHNCKPADNIKRSEVAAILTRMMNDEARIKFSI